MEDTKFKYDDKVKVIKGFYRGKTGTAISYYSTSTGCFNNVITHWYSIEVDGMNEGYYSPYTSSPKLEIRAKRISFKDNELELVNE